MGSDSDHLHIRALLTENGPCTVNEDGKSTSLNPHSWTEAGHVLWLDQPAGVGFSYGSETDINQEMVSEDAYWFLQKFFQEHPEYSENPLFIVISDDEREASELGR